MSELVPPTPPAPAPAPASREPEVFSREYVSELRGENASQRVARQAAEAKAQAAEENATKATTEAKASIEAATKSANERIIRAELKASAIKAGMVDIDGLKLADLSKVKLNEAGEVEGADALMEELKKSKPFLFGTATTTGSTTPPPKPAPGAQTKATEMTPEEYKVARAKIRQGILPQATA